MPSGYGSSQADIINQEDLLNIGNIAQMFGEMLEYMDKVDTDLEAMGTAYEFSEDLGDISKDENKELKGFYKEIQCEFEKETGLTVFIGYHDSGSNGSCYDAVDGVYWWVDGMYELTPAGDKMKGIVSREGWVTYG